MKPWFLKVTHFNNKGTFHEGLVVVYRKTSLILLKCFSPLTVLIAAELEWKVTKNGPLTSITSRMVSRSPSLVILQMKLQSVVFPSHHDKKMEMHSFNSWMKALLVLLKNSTESRRRNPPWYYSLRQVKR